MNNTHKYDTQSGLARPGTQGRYVLRVFAVCLLMGLCGSRAGAALILNDTFSDGSSTNQALPGSANWVTGGPSNNASVTNGALTFADANAGKATAMAYFNAVDLQVGQSLTLSFDYSFTKVANADNSFMFGLYDSGGSYQAKDTVGFNNKIFDNYTGYATSGVFGNDPSGPGRDHIEVRNESGHNLLSIGTYTEGQEYLQSGAATPGQTYTASMKLSRTAAGMTVTSQIGNTVMAQTYSSEMFTHFDTVGIFSNGDTGVFTLDNVKLDYMGAPEPSSVYGMAFLGLVVFGRVVSERLKRFAFRLAV